MKEFDRPLTNFEYRIGIVIGYFLYLSFCIVDYYLMPLNFKTAWVVRGLTLIPAVIILVITFSDRYDKQLLKYLFFLFQYIIISFSIILYHIEFSEIAFWLYPYGYVLIILWFSMVLQMPFKQNLFLVCLIVISYLVITLAHNRNYYVGYYQIWAIGNTLIIFCSIILVIVGSYFINRHLKTLRNSQLQLESEHSELVIAKLKAEESDRLKSTFLANLSHEIRTPLNAIAGFSELISEEDVSKEERKFYSKLILQNSEGLVELIEEIIEFSRIESGQAKVIKRDISLNDLVERVNGDLSNISKNLLKDGVKFVTNFNKYSDIVIHIDDYKTRHIIKQLTHNALKFTSNGHIEVGIQEISDSMLTFYIEDTGIGFDEKEAEIIFSRFTQANKSIQCKHGGVGIGLSVVKQLVELLDGELNYSSKAGVGTCFTVAVPIHQ